MSKLRIVKGNTFETVIQVKAYTYRGEEIPDFDLRKCTDVIANSIVNGKSKPIKLFEIIDEQHMVLAWPAKYQEVGSYQLEVKGKLNGVDWRFYDKKPIFDIVLTNFEANIPQWSIIRDNFYTVDKQSIYMLDGIGAITNNDFATVATTGSYNDLIDKPELFDGDYTNLTNKPDLSIYQLKDGDKVLSDNNYTNEDKATVESVSTDYYTKSQIDTDFQSKLVSGTNIKTINGQSVLGNGNINLLTFVATNTLPPADANTVDKIYLVPSNDPNEAADNIKEEWITITSQTTVIGALEVYQEDDPDWDQSNDAILLGFVNGVCGYYVVDYQELGSFIPLKLGDTINDNSISKHYTVITRNGNPTWSGALEGIVTEPTTLYNWELIGSTQVNLENYYTKSQIDTNFQAIQSLSAVALSGSYNDLSNKPTVDNASGGTTIWEPILEIFADQACTTKPTGIVNKVYAKTYKSFGFDDAMSFGTSTNPSSCANIFTPTTQVPEDACDIRVWVDFCANLDPIDYMYSIPIGVYELTYSSGDPTDPGIDVTNFKTRFYENGKILL